MDKGVRAVIVVTGDDVNDYFLVINLENGQEIKRFSTEDFGTWRYDDNYDEEAMVAKVAGACNLFEFNVIHWY